MRWDVCAGMFALRAGTVRLHIEDWTEPFFFCSTAHASSQPLLWPQQQPVTPRGNPDWQSCFTWVFLRIQATFKSEYRPEESTSVQRYTGSLMRLDDARRLLSEEEGFSMVMPESDDHLGA